MSKAIPVHVQSKRDQDASKKNPVRVLKDMTPEERAKVLASIEAQDYERARKRAEENKRGRR